jgi:enoyl-[acyl-carrier protein] reductase III
MADRPHAGQVALVTGSSRGIGRATAELLARRGAEVVIHYRRDEPAALEAKRAIQTAGGTAHVVCADLRDPAAVTGMMDALAQRVGRLDILVANAASSAFKPLLEVEPRHVEMTFHTTFTAFLVMVQKALPLMRGRAGHIVTVSGFDTLRALPGHGLLGAAKAALETATRYFAAELAPHGVNVNGIVPGFVETASAQLYADTQEPGGYAAARERWAAQTPRGRVASAEDIARAIAMLCGPDARWITGQVIVADGGLTLR